MGQSMSQPSSPKLNHDKLSQRSLYRTVKSSANVEQNMNQYNHRISSNYFEPTPEKSQNDAQKRVAFYPSSGKLQYKQANQHKSFKSFSKIRSELIGEQSIYSPNFKQITEEERDSIMPDKQISLVKPVEKSHSQSHNDITISFSKTKNLNSHHFQEETLLPRENLSKILEDEEHSHHSLQNEQPNNFNQNYREQKQQTINNTGQQVGGNKDQANMINELKQSKTITSQNKLDQQARKDNRNQKLSNCIKLQQFFDDYNYRDLGFNPQKHLIRKEKKIKPTQQFQTLRQTVLKVGETNQQNKSLIKSFSLQNLSQSLGQRWSNSKFKSYRQKFIKSKFHKLSQECKQINIQQNNKLFLPRQQKNFSENDLRTPRQSKVVKINDNPDIKQKYENLKCKQLQGKKLKNTQIKLAFNKRQYDSKILKQHQNAKCKGNQIGQAKRNSKIGSKIVYDIKDDDKKLNYEMAIKNEKDRIKKYKRTSGKSLQGSNLLIF